MSTFIRCPALEQNGMKCELSGKDIYVVQNEMYAQFPDMRRVSKESAARLPKWIARDLNRLNAFCKAWKFAQLTFGTFAIGHWIWDETSNCIYETSETYTVDSFRRNSYNPAKHFHYFHNGKYQCSKMLDKNCVIDKDGVVSLSDPINEGSMGVLHPPMATNDPGCLDKKEIDAMSREEMLRSMLGREHDVDWASLSVFPDPRAFENWKSFPLGPTLPLYQILKELAPIKELTPIEPKTYTMTLNKLRQRLKGEQS